MNCKGTEKYASLCVIDASNFKRWFADAITFPPEGRNIILKMPKKPPILHFSISPYWRFGGLEVFFLLILILIL